MRVPMWATMLLLLAGQASAERVSLAVTEHGSMIDGRQEAGRHLLRTEAISRIPHLESAAISRATLSFSILGAVEDRDLVLEVRPLLTDWNAAALDWTTGWETPGGDIDLTLRSIAEVDLRRGARTVTVDVTSMIVDGLVAGSAPYGFAIGASGGRALARADMDRISLVGATVEVAYKLVGRPRTQR